MGKKNESPLLDIAVQYMIDAKQGMTDQEVKQCKEMMKKFIQNDVPFEIADDTIYSITHSHDAVERVDAILNVSDEPLDEFSLEEEKLSGRRRTHSWSVLEDNRLIYAIHHGGFGDWSRVAHFVGNGRTRSQCSQRWHRTLDPRINKNNWNETDDAKLLEAVSKFGVNTWTKVAKYVGARTDVQCRYRYMLIKKHGSSNSLKRMRNRQNHLNKKENIESSSNYESDFNDESNDAEVDSAFDSINEESNSSPTFQPAQNKKEEDSFDKSLFEKELGDDSIDTIWKTLFADNSPFDFGMNIEVI